jgi:hypothetical protein
MDGITTTPIEATTTSVVECYAQGNFLTLAPFVLLDSANKGVTYGPDIYSASRPGPGVYRFNLREPYALLLWADMRIDGQSGGALQFEAQPSLVGALPPPAGGASVSIVPGTPPLGPFIEFLVTDATTGVLADPGDDVMFVVALKLRNRQIGV